MVNREANIDLLFRNGLSDYEALPPSDVWEGIKPVINRPKRSFTYLRIAASVAVIITSGLLTAMLIRNLPSSSENNSLIVAPGIKSVSVQEENIVQPGQTLALQEREPFIGDQVPVSDANSSNVPATLLTLPAPELFTPFVKDKPSGDIRKNSRPGSVQKAYNPTYSDIASDASVQVKENIPLKTNRWSVGAMVSPAYYSWFSLSGNDAASEIIKSEEAAFSYTGGLTFAYNINRRFTVQSGLNYSSIGQRIEGVTSYSGFGRFLDSKGESQFGVVTSSGTITTRNGDIYLADNNSGARVMSLYTREVFDPEKNDLSYISSSLSQSFNYVEVPVYLKYKLIDRNVDLKIIGGVSYNVLVSNTAFTSSGGTKYYIGKTEGLSPVTLSSSLGMGMEYSFSGRLSLNLEPTFRYYITAPGGLAGSTIHPYSFGILSGVSYKF
jgi:hypothetical protein